MVLQDREDALLDASTRMLVELLHHVIAETVIHYLDHVFLFQGLPHFLLEYRVTVHDGLLSHVAAVLVSGEQEEVRQQYLVEHVFLVRTVFGLQNVLHYVVGVLLEREFHPGFQDLEHGGVQQLPLLGRWLLGEYVDQFLDDQAAVLVET